MQGKGPKHHQESQLGYHSQCSSTSSGSTMGYQALCMTLVHYIERDAGGYPQVGIYVGVYHYQGGCNQKIPGLEVRDFIFGDLNVTPSPYMSPRGGPLH